MSRATGNVLVSYMHLISFMYVYGQGLTYNVTFIETNPLLSKKLSIFKYEASLQIFSNFYQQAECMSQFLSNVVWKCWKPFKTITHIYSSLTNLQNPPSTLRIGVVWDAILVLEC